MGVVLPRVQPADGEYLGRGLAPKKATAATVSDQERLQMFVPKCKRRFTMLDVPSDLQ